jgi:hypothetical protein
MYNPYTPSASAVLLHSLSGQLERNLEIQIKSTDHGFRTQRLAVSFPLLFFLRNGEGILLTPWLQTDPLIAVQSVYSHRF